MLELINTIFGVVIVIAIVVLLFKGGKSNYDKVDIFLKLLKERDFEKWKSLGEPRISTLMPNSIVSDKNPFLMSNMWAYFMYTKFEEFSDQELQVAYNEVKDTFSVKPFDLIAVIAILAIFIGALVYATLF
jgi:hypothetical protein